MTIERKPFKLELVLAYIKRRSPVLQTEVAHYFMKEFEYKDENSCKISIHQIIQKLKKQQKIRIQKKVVNGFATSLNELTSNE